MLNRKRILGIILILGILIGIPIGSVLSNGGNPTFDELLGIFNVPWGNFTQGVDAPNYYRNGQDYSEWIESISGEANDYSEQFYNFLVYTNDTHKFALYGDNETLAFSSIYTSTVLQNCVDALVPNGGTIVIKEGEFTGWPTPVVIDYGAAGYYGWTGNATVIRGAGLGATQFIADDGVNAFELTNQSIVHWMDFSVETKNAHCFYSYSSHIASQDRGAYWNTFTRINAEVVVGSTSGYLWYIENPDWVTWHHIRGRSAGTGAILLHTLDDATFSYGNSRFSGVNFLYSTVDDSAVIELRGSGGHHTECVYTESRIYLFGGTTTTGETALLLNGTRHCNIEIKFENLLYGVRLIGENEDNTVSAPDYNILEDGGTYINCTSGAVLNHFRDFFIRYLGGSSTNTVLVDGQTDWRKRNTFEDFTIWSQAGTIHVNKSAVSELIDWVTYDYNIATNHTISTPFIAGTEFTSTASEPQGWLIDSTNDWACTSLTLPWDFKRINSIWIYAVTNVTEADAMRLTIYIAGGEPNSIWSAEVAYKSTCYSYDSNMDQYDVVRWRLRVADDSDIGDWEAGYSLQIKITYSVAGNGDCATEAWFRNVLIEYI